MAHPVFIHVTSTGDLWLSIDQSFTPAGVVAATYRIYSSARTQKLGAVTGTSGSYAASNGTGKHGAERT